MNKKIRYTSLFALFCASALSAFGADYTANGGEQIFSNPKAWDKGSVPTASDRIILNANGTLLVDGDFTYGALIGNYGTSNSTIKTLEGKTFTINSFSITYQANSNKNAMLTFANSGGYTDANPYAYIVKGDFTLASNGGSATVYGGENSSLTVKVDAPIKFTKTGTTNINANNTTTHVVQPDDSVGRIAKYNLDLLGRTDVAGDVSFASARSAAITNPYKYTVNVGSTNNSTATLNVVNGLKTLDADTTLNVYGTVNVGSTTTGSGSTAWNYSVWGIGGVNIVSGGNLKATYEGSTFSSARFKNLNLAGTFTYTTSSDYANQDCLVVDENGSINVKAGGQIKVVEKVGAAECHINVSKGGTFTYEAGAKANSGIVRLKLGGDGATAKIYESGVVANTSLTITANGINTNLVVGADTSFSNIHLFGAGTGTNEVGLKITFENDATLSFANIVGGGATSYNTRNFYVELVNFVDNGDTSSLRFTNATFVSEVSGSTSSAWIAKYFSAEDYENFWVDSNGYLHATKIIPEPAEWAVIFGAIALGFAWYRRRK